MCKGHLPHNRRLRGGPVRAQSLGLCLCAAENYSELPIYEQSLGLAVSGRYINWNFADVAQHTSRRNVGSIRSFTQAAGTFLLLLRAIPQCFTRGASSTPL